MVFLVRRGYSYWLVLAFSFLASLFLVRIFIFFHDCAHNSFFASSRANRIVGYICGILTFTPYDDWRRSHGIHHGTAQDLDRRGTGDVPTLTVAEYLAAPKRARIAYRLYRNPFILFGPVPLIYFMIRLRFPNKAARKRERNSVILTDLAILAIIGIAGSTIGLGTYFLIQLLTMEFAATIGVWLFFVQHQFEGVYWARHENWDPLGVSLRGASFYKLPGILQWFTSNIGFHHAHHLRPLIPNYNLPQFYNAVPALQAVNPLTIRRSLKSLRLNLWDEENQKLVSFREIRKQSRADHRESNQFV